MKFQEVFKQSNFNSNNPNASKKSCERSAKNEEAKFSHFASYPHIHCSQNFKISRANVFKPVFSCF